MGEEGRHTKFLIGVQIVDSSPGVLSRTTGDETTSLVVHGHTGDLVLEVDLLEQSARRCAIEQIHTLPGGDAQDARVVRHGGQAVEFAAANGALDRVLDNRMS